VSKSELQARLLELTGATPITVNGQTFRITDRWSPTSKAHFREYFTQYFAALGISVNTIPFPVDNLVGESEGHNVEAVLPGQSADTVVIIVHYDSVGIPGEETLNPAADDDGSGTAMMLEAARIFSALPRRAYTVRFVGADYEELTDLQGDAAYVSYLQNEAQTKNFQILVASDNDQTGWSCWSEGLCGSGAPPANSSLLMVSCSGDSYGYDYPALRAGFKAIASKYSTMKADYSCDGSGDTDHYSFWQAGLPAYVIMEYGTYNNPHFDDLGDDTMAHIDLDYLWHIAQIQIAYQAQLVGVTP
jgi:Zn-dependent M28 family amino/carboxypeptidase